MSAQRPIYPAPGQWSEDAACLDIDTNIFYPSSKIEYAIRVAKQICRSCPVLEACEEWAMTEPLDPYGIAGALTPGERYARKYGKERPTKW